MHLVCEHTQLSQQSAQGFIPDPCDLSLTLDWKRLGSQSYMIG